MKLDDNINYFIECGDDIEEVVRFVVKRGGYGDWDIDELREKLFELKGISYGSEYEDMGGILLTRGGDPLWADTISMNDGHLEQDWQPLVRIKLGVVSKRIPKLTI